MTAIRIHTRLESDTLHLPQLLPLVGRRVEIVVVDAEETPERPTEDAWDAALLAARSLTDYDWDAAAKQDAVDRRHAGDHLP